MVQQVQRRKPTDKASKAKESAVEAIRQAGQIASAGSDVSIDAVADRIQRRADVADARFERALGEMNGEVEKDVVIAQAQARLEQRKAPFGAPRQARQQGDSQAGAGLQPAGAVDLEDDSR